VTDGVSVVVPVRNGAMTIGETLRSVAAQTHRGPIEVIVVDNESTDGTVELARAALPCVRAVAQRGGGLPAARNRGAHVSTQPWLAFLDCDDLWHPRHLELLLRRAAAHGEAPAVSSSAQRFSTVPLSRPVVAPVPALAVPLRAASRPVRLVTPPALATVACEPVRQLDGLGEPWSIDHLDLLVASPFLSSNALVSRDLFAAAGGFPLTFPGAEDFAFFLALTRLTPILVTPDITFFYRVSETSMTSRTNTGLSHLAAVAAFAAGPALERSPEQVLASLRRARFGRDVLRYALGQSLWRGCPHETRFVRALAPAVLSSRRERLRFTVIAAWETRAAPRIGPRRRRPAGAHVDPPLPGASPKTAKPRGARGFGDIRSRQSLT